MRAVRPLYPRGPRSGPGYSVPVHHHLIGPIRPTRRHIQTSPLAAYTGCLRCAYSHMPRQPTTGSELSLMIFHNMSSSETTGNSSVAYTQLLHRRRWPSTRIKVSAFPSSSHSDSGEGDCFRGLTTVRLRYDLLLLLALLSEQTRFAPSPRGRLLPGFRRFGHPPRRRISLQCQLGNLHWQDFHLLDHQLASLHYPGAL